MFFFVFFQGYYDSYIAKCVQAGFRPKTVGKWVLFPSPSPIVDGFMLPDPTSVRPYLGKGLVTRDYFREVGERLVLCSQDLVCFLLFCSTVVQHSAL